MSGASDRKQRLAAALREKEYGIWQTTTWIELLKEVEHLACGLHQAGLHRGEHLIVVGANRPRLYATMLAAQSLGAIPIPLYQDAVAAECVFPINNAQVRFAVVEDQEQVDKLLEIREQCPQLSHIYYDDPRGLRNYEEPGLSSMEELQAAGLSHAQQHPNLIQEEIAKAHPDDVAAMFFTSGTTGNPKGVVHTHRSLLDRAQAGAVFDRLTSSEDVLAYLPPAWIGQNIFSYAQWLVCGYVVNCPESGSTVTIDLKEIGPTYYFAPPRVFEGMLTSVSIRMEDASHLKRRLFRHFMDVAQRVGPALMDGNLNLSDNAILEIIRRYTKEAGVRNLDRQVATICRKVARKVAEADATTDGPTLAVQVRADDLAPFLGPIRFDGAGRERHDEAGVAYGLAVTETVEPGGTDIGQQIHFAVAQVGFHLVDVLRLPVGVNDFEAHDGMAIRFCWLHIQREIRTHAVLIQRNAACAAHVHAF